MLASKILDGKRLSKKILDHLKSDISLIKTKYTNFQPGLAIIQIGNREDSNIYIKNKIKAASNIGIDSNHFKFDKNINELELLNEIKNLNNDKNIHGIIVQLPFDSKNKLNTDLIINTVDSHKDVDGLTNINAGKLSTGGYHPQDGFIPCTPKGCLELIKSTGVNLCGKNAVVVGRSRLIGTPMANLLKWHDSTVTICHSKTENLDKICQMADVLVVAIGKANYVKGNWIKPGAIVIDCGINAASENNKSKLVGDVDFQEASKVTSYITPVPGGVGPMTVSMLLLNTFQSALRFNKITY